MVSVSFGQQYLDLNCKFLETNLAQFQCYIAFLLTERSYHCV